MKLMGFLRILIIVVPSLLLSKLQASEPAKKTAATKSTVTTERTEKILTTLYTICNPTAERCRPGIHASPTKLFEMNPDEDQLSDTSAMLFSCMLKGFKQVWWEIDELEHLQEDLSELIPGITSEDIKALMDYKNIRELRVKIPEESRYLISIVSDSDSDTESETTVERPKRTELSSEFDHVFYTPAGKVKAYLFYKYLVTQLHSVGHVSSSHEDYIVGHLLGYPDPDIKAFYYYNHLKGSTQEKVDKLFLDDKTKGEAWLKANTPGIEEWVEKKLIEQRSPVQVVKPGH